jgi:hypothetical protein
VLPSSAKKKSLASCRRPGTLVARVHEIYVHYEPRKDGGIRHRTLVVLPIFRSGSSVATKQA